ncbi:MAG: LytTR family DNA-binding domain-containing protein, partial [Spirochaetales bacterium]|nr:LytTR family DNA-binding domain-containing protein [Spirochaetales bacterium]
MIRTLIVDDEKPARDELSWLLNRERDIELVGEAANGMEALELAESLSPDLILLDIQMPGMSGLETARQLMALPVFPQIIFITAYDRFAIEAFDVNAVDYLLKPVEEERVNRALNRVRNRISSQDMESRILGLLKTGGLGGSGESEKKKIRKLTVYSEGHFKPVDFDDIVMISADGRQSVVHSLTGSYPYRTGLSELEGLLGDMGLFKCHRSFSINPAYIETVEPWFNSSYKIRMEGQKELVPVSRSHTAALKSLLNM